MEIEEAPKRNSDSKWQGCDGTELNHPRMELEKIVIADSPLQAVKISWSGPWGHSHA
ncbi:hypothetical protein VINI7043_04510 [Vibrio nigripulchritudo ATCC 27043]|uniref:Uncharacterized protein n=1 Tax=Vibrio nigripulchritudo SOn1 TaxID=1238450 RepID=A0AAV2VPC9_9VIBR|nr:hypothetical protein VINI7043_04510 [Vibrio nigripulchritudo ATCC 27043]BCL72881.1 hypothetical protein VNTUMSATTG_48180 [Vibrio nigripulchritudo]BDU34245.1 hypothetical protein TUMSATVNIG1_48540 [Vibrio nigripulchritudo]CCO46578.1 hypothetical protein VIBNISOn1_1810037 [Vibrio nigripulchritudo SOn1]